MENHQDLTLPRTETIDLEGVGSKMIPHPHQFQPYPKIIGGNFLAKEVNNLLDFAPSLQGHIKSVQFGPNSDVLKRLAGDEADGKPRFRGEDFEDTNLQGVTNMNTGEIALNPDLRSNDLLRDAFRQNDVRAPVFRDDTTTGVLAHEAAHTLGRREGAAYAVSDAIRDWFGGRLPR